MKKFYFLFFFLFVITWQSAVCAVAQQQITELDSLLSVLKTAKDTHEVNTLVLVAKQYNKLADYEQSLNYARKAHQKAQKLGYKKGYANAYLYMGIIHANKADYQEAITHYTTAIPIYTEIGDKIGLANCYNNIGTVYMYMDDYTKSLEYILKALEIREEINDKNGVGSAYLNIGNIYLSQGNNEKSLEYYLKSLRIAEEISNQQLQAKNLNNLGVVYQNLDSIDKAEEYYLKSVDMNKKLNFKKSVALSYNNLGLIYDKKKNYDKALLNTLQATEIYKSTGDLQGIAMCYTNIGNMYAHEQKYTEAQRYLLEALDLNKTIGHRAGMLDAYVSLSELFENKDDFKSALKYHKLYSTTRDSLVSEESGRLIEEMNTKYGTEKKDKEILLLNKEKEKQADLAASESRRHQIILLSVSIVLLLVAIFAFFTYRNNKLKQRLNKELEKLSIVASETDNGVLICGPKGEIEWANAALTRLLGYTFEELKQKGTTISELSSNPDIKNVIQESINNKQSSTYEVLNITKDGKQRWTQSTLTPILDFNGNIKKLVIIDADITERKKIEEKLIEQNLLVEEKNHKITDSINYAQRIQQAILPSQQMLNRLLPDSFIFFKPKDIVSGDFYWAYPVNEHTILFAAVDCTGHGVPGALMSIMGYNLLEQIVKEQKIHEPAAILNELSRLVIVSLKQSNQVGSLKEGMDIALCKINYASMELEYAGAHNSLNIVSKGVLTETKADSRSIGIALANSKPFTNHTKTIQKGDCIYIFSDGYADQQGGPLNKKFFSQSLRQLLTAIHSQPMKTQAEKLEQVITDWKGNNEQIDDMLVVGVRI